MAKKHWIYIKRGLSEDPKHRAAMGECVWLFMHIIDRADWETGIAYDWKDDEEAAAMGMNAFTLRDQRQKLQRLDYIHCTQKQHGQDITILEWVNPRDYSSGVKNRRNELTTPEPEIQGKPEPSPSDPQGKPEPSPSDFQGNTQDDTQVLRKSLTPTLDSTSKSPSSINREALELFVEHLGKFLSVAEIERWLALYETYGKERAGEISSWAARKEIHMTNRQGLLDSLETAAKNWKANNHGGQPQSASVESSFDLIDRVLGVDNG
jgi:hypothetical protein